MYDLLLRVLPELDACAESLLSALELHAGRYALVTLHRAANTDHEQTMRQLAEAINRLQMPVIFPLHPRTRASIERYGINWRSHVHLIEPVGYREMLTLERAASCILTDSGGVQKEAFFLGVPCVTLRTETEWPETVATGWNVLVGCDVESILAACQRPMPPPPTSRPFGEGDAAQRIARSLTAHGRLKAGRAG
jgi:UDP-N-acetylglucosamine 2-epimerase